MNAAGWQWKLFFYTKRSFPVQFILEIPGASTWQCQEKITKKSASLAIFESSVGNWNCMLYCENFQDNISVTMQQKFRFTKKQTTSQKYRKAAKLKIVFQNESKWGRHTRLHFQGRDKSHVQLLVSGVCAEKVFFVRATVMVAKSLQAMKVWHPLNADIWLQRRAIQLFWKLRS